MEWNYNNSVAVIHHCTYNRRFFLYMQTSLARIYINAGWQAICCGIYRKLASYIRNTQQQLYQFFHRINFTDFLCLLYNLRGMSVFFSCQIFLSSKRIFWQIMFLGIPHGCGGCDLFAANIWICRVGNGLVPFRCPDPYYVYRMFQIYRFTFSRTIWYYILFHKERQPDKRIFY